MIVRERELSVPARPAEPGAQASGSKRKGGTHHHVWTIVVVLLTGAASAHAQTVRILRVAVVTDDFVRVSDVAELSGLDATSAEVIGNLRVARSPAPGARRWIKRDEISQALKAGSVNFATISLKGSTQCDVSRPATMPEAPTTTEQPGSDRRIHLDDKPSRSKSHVTNLADAVRAYIKNRVADLGGEVSVALPSTVQEALGLSTPQYNFRIRTVGSHRLGMVSLEVQIRQGGRLEQTLPMVAEVLLTKKVVVARRPVNRNAVVRTEDLTFAERTFEHADDVPIGDAAALVGNRARRFVPVDDVIRARDVKALTLIDRNDRVSVTLRRGRIIITTVAKARESGGYGDVIEVLNEASRETYFVRVTGPGTAEVTDAPARELVAMSHGRFER